METMWDWVSPGLVGFSVEFTWAAQESVIIPYLHWLGLPMEYSGVSYLLNPIIGIFLQPYIGSVSDKYGKRKPFVALLAATGVIGLSLLIFSYDIGSAVFGENHTIIIIIALTGMTISDISHDCLLVPARAMVQDYCKNSTAERNRQNAHFSKLQVLGRLFALVSGSFSIGKFILPAPFVDPLPQDGGVVEHAMALLVLALIVLVTTAGLVLGCLPSETLPSSDIDVLDPAGDERSHAEESAALLENVHAESADYASTSVTDPSILTPVLVTVNRSDQPTSLVDDGEVPQDNGPAPLFHPKEYRRRKMLFRIVLVMQFYGWVCTMAQTFYWTTFLHGKSIHIFGARVRIAFFGLALGAMVSFVTSLHMPKLNKRFGALQVYVVAELTLMTTLLLLNVTGDGVGTILIGALSGLHYVIHINNPFVILHVGHDDEDSDSDDGDDDAGSNAWLVGLISASLPAAQILVGSCAGFLFKDLFKEDFIKFFSFVGMFGWFIDGVCVILLRRLFLGRRHFETEAAP